MATDLREEDGSSQSQPCADAPSALAQDVVRLVIAAREVVFGDGYTSLRELDAASEAFASRVPWNNAPNPNDTATTTYWAVEDAVQRADAKLDLLRQVVGDAPSKRATPSHTPGPWSADEEDGPILYEGMLRPVWNIHGGAGLRDGRLVCSVERFKQDDYPNANARLIAAAPDLLETLQRIAAATPASTNSATIDQFMSWIDAVAAEAIARATGAAQ